MTDIKLAPGFWRTRGGRRAEVVGQAFNGEWVGIVEYGGACVNAWHPDGRTCRETYLHSWDIVGAWTEREPIKGEAHAVLNDDGTVNNIQIGGIVSYTGRTPPRYVRIRYEEIDG